MSADAGQWFLPGAWALLVVGGLFRFRPVPRRLRVALDCGVARAWFGSPGLAPRSVHSGPLTGAVIAVGLLVGPWPAAAVVASIVGASGFQRRRSLRCRADGLVAELPEAIELLFLAVGSGLTVRLALLAVGPRLNGETGTAFADACHALETGERTADAIERLSIRLGDGGRPLVFALLDAERYGAPLGPALERLADDARAHRRRQAEERARRVPVKLLFPLVFCVLPAFVVLTVVPILFSTVDRLTLP